MQRFTDCVLNRSDAAVAGAGFGVLANGTNVTGAQASNHPVYTNTSSQINIQLSTTAATSFEIRSYGWRDSRGRLA